MMMWAVKLEYVKMEFVEVINDFNSIKMSTEICRSLKLEKLKMLLNS